MRNLFALGKRSGVVNFHAWEQITVRLPDGLGESVEVRKVFPPCMNATIFLLTAAYTSMAADDARSVNHARIRSSATSSGGRHKGTAPPTTAWSQERQAVECNLNSASPQTRGCSKAMRRGHGPVARSRTTTNVAPVPTSTHHVTPCAGRTRHRARHRTAGCHRVLPRRDAVDELVAATARPKAITAEARLRMAVHVVPSRWDVVTPFESMAAVPREIFDDIINRVAPAHALCPTLSKERLRPRPPLGMAAHPHLSLGNACPDPRRHVQGILGDLARRQRVLRQQAAALETHHVDHVPARRLQEIVEQRDSLQVVAALCCLRA